MPKFDLGQVVMTRGVQEAIERHPEGNGMDELVHIIYKRHAEGDWCNDGDLDQPPGVVCHFQMGFATLL